MTDSDRPVFAALTAAVPSITAGVEKTVGRTAGSSVCLPVQVWGAGRQFFVWLGTKLHLNLESS